MRKLARQKCHLKQPGELTPDICSFVNNAIQAMLVADFDGVICHVNTPWIELFGYSLEEVKGREAFLLSTGEPTAGVYRELWQAISERRLFQTQEIVDTKKDGSTCKLKTVIFTFDHCGTLYYVQVVEELE